MEKISSSDTTVNNRRIASVIGCFIADAAAQPLHWNYDLKKLDEIVGDKPMEFWNPSRNPFYTLPTGRNTVYGDHIMSLLKSVYTAKGFSAEEYAKELVNMFGPDSDYEKQPLNAIVVDKDVKKKLPIEGPWRSACVKYFLQNHLGDGQENNLDKMKDMHAVVPVVPIVAVYAGKENMLEMVEASIRVVLTSQKAVSYGLAAARILEQYILYGEKADNALDVVIKELKNPERKNPTPLDATIADEFQAVINAKDIPHRKAATEVFKNQCYVPEAFQSTLHCLINTTDYCDAIQTTMRAAGCTSRCSYVGACLAARNGIECIPDDWKMKTNCFDSTLKMMQELCK
ncbi:crystallin J1A-like [Antedon mediterranea]|uniref:crystallin J1A-like n=1 Tax=Antedon mediterranea TaxID=105859 RepID=UPI003AF961ED